MSLLFSWVDRMSAIFFASADVLFCWVLSFVVIFNMWCFREIWYILNI